MKEGETRFKVSPHTREVLWKSSKKGHHLPDPVLLSIPSSALLPPLAEVTQTGRTRLNPVLQQLQDFHQARTQLECELGEAAQKLAYKYNDHWAKLVRKHKCKWAKMAQEGNRAFQEVFTMSSPAESIKLLPGAFLLGFHHYISEVLAATAQLGANAPSYCCSPQLEESPIPGSLSSPAHLTGTPPPQHFSCQISPLWALPWWGDHLSHS